MMIFRATALLLCWASCSLLSGAEDNPLADAAETKNWSVVKSLLDQKVNPNTAQVDGMTALHWATHHNEAGIVQLLIESGADVKVGNRYGVTALSLACTNGNSKIVDALLTAGANADGALNGGETVLMIAARTGNVAVVEALVTQGPKVNAIDRKGQDALMWAAAEGNNEVIDFLIKAGANPNTLSKEGFTPLFFAARDGHIAAVRSLLNGGADLKYKKGTGRSGGKSPPRGTDALRFAVENGHFELAVVLLEAGADPNNQNSGHTPLHVLTWLRKPNRGDGDDGAPPPTGSGKTTSLEFARQLVSRFDANPNLRLKHGTAGGARLMTRGATPFLLAAKTADLPYLKLLLELGADPSIPNDNGTTPLMAAAGVGTHAPTEEAGTEEECVAAAKWLLMEGAKINFVNKRGDSVMHGAAYKSLPKMVEFLHENGAEIKFWNLKNKRGHTPLLIAQGFRPGNFKPSPETTAAIEAVMRLNGVEPLPPPPRPVVGKPEEYQK